MSMIEKPIVFFSHSSKDKAILDELKTLLIQKTGNVIEIFLSSDGQSIRLGKNWAHRIEDALKKAKISFVFISPNSLQSKWLFFESGFSYARDIQVIPVGILGIDLDGIPPPLNILQGFNIRNEDGLNNILSTFNKEFGFTFPESFTKEEYDKIFSSHEIASQNGLGIFSQYIDNIVFEISEPKTLSIEFLKKYFDSIFLPYQSVDDFIQTYGITITFREGFAVREKRGTIYIDIELDPSLTKITFPLLKHLLKIENQDTEIIKFYIRFESNVRMVLQLYRLTSLMYNSGISLGQSNSYNYQNIEFKLDTNPDILMYIVLKDGKLETELLLELLTVLFERKVLRID